MHMWTSAVRTRPRGFEYLELYERNPKLRLEKIVSKSVSLELGSGLVQITFNSQVPAFGIKNLARPVRSVR